MSNACNCNTVLVCDWLFYYNGNECESTDAPLLSRGVVLSSKFWFDKWTWEQMTNCFSTWTWHLPLRQNMVSQSWRLVFRWLPSLLLLFSNPYVAIIAWGWLSPSVVTKSSRVCQYINLNWIKVINNLTFVLRLAVSSSFDQSLKKPIMHTMLDVWRIQESVRRLPEGAVATCNWKRVRVHVMAFNLSKLILILIIQHKSY